MSEPYLGEIKLFPFSWAPRGFALCNGALMPIQQNSALFSLLGVKYGGNGTTNFGLPDLRGRVILHGTTAQGAQFGVESVSLTQAQMPTHQHAMQATTVAGDRISPGVDSTALYAMGNYESAYGPATPLVAMNASQLSVTGGNVPHTNIQPSLVLNYVIATTGVYPSRN